jgi:hypothetical protein
MQGLGNVLLALDDVEGAEEAFAEALVQAELLLKLEPSKPVASIVVVSGPSMPITSIDFPSKSIFS